MANKTIAQLTAAGSAATTNLFEIDNGSGASFKLTLDQIITLLESSAPLASALLNLGAPALSLQGGADSTMIFEGSSFQVGITNGGSLGIFNTPASIAQLFDENNVGFNVANGATTLTDLAGSSIVLDGGGNIAVNAAGVSGSVTLGSHFLALNPTTLQINGTNGFTGTVHPITSITVSNGIVTAAS